MQSCLCFTSVSVLEFFYISPHSQAKLFACTFLSISNKSHTGRNSAQQGGNKWLYAICFKENTTALIIIAALWFPIPSVSIVSCIIYSPSLKTISKASWSFIQLFSNSIFRRKISYSKISNTWFYISDVNFSAELKQIAHRTKFDTTEYDYFLCSKFEVLITNLKHSDNHFL